METAAKSLPPIRRKSVTMDMPRFFLVLALAFSLSLFAPAGAAEAYAKPPAFEPLPLGAVRPTGWLRDWCQTAARGITGNADKISPVIGKGWVGEARVDVKKSAMQTGDRPKGYMLEQAAYWLDGAVRLAHLLDDKALLAKCRLRFDAVLDRVEAGLPPMNVNGDMWQRGEKWAHWPMAVLARALVAEYSATGDPRYLRGLEKIYADYSKRNVDGATFSLIDHNGRQPMNTEAMLEAFRLGGNRNLRDEALVVLREQEPEIKRRLTWHEKGLADGKMDAHFSTVQFGHAVTFNESAKMPAIGSLYTGDPTWLRFSEESFADMKKNEMLPYGLTSAHEQPGGIEPFALTELCNAVDYSWSNIWLLRITGKGAYGDAVEQTVFNAGAGGVSPDFKEHVYYLSPNRIDATHPHRSSTGAGGSAEFAPTHQPLCCTANISRLLPNYVMHLWMASADGGLAATLYGPSVARTTVRGVPVMVETKTDYPFRDEVLIRISAARPTAFPLHLRAPAWSGAPVVAVNGAPQATTVEDGFVRIDRTWAPRDIVSVTFSRVPKVVAGVCADGSPYASVFYGPLLFALPIPIQGRDLNVPAARMESQFALAPNAPAKVVLHPLPAAWSWSAKPPPVELQVSAQPFASDADFSLAPAPVPVDPAKAKTITLVPFGSTAFRVSMFSLAGPPPG